MYLTDKQEIFFKHQMLTLINDEEMPLPEKLEFNKVYKSAYYKYGNRGARDLRFVVTKNDVNEVIVDYFFITDDFSSHMRINENGEVTKLENFEGQFGWPILQSEEETKKEHERIMKHNQIVQEILITKGLEEV